MARLPLAVRRADAGHFRGAAPDCRRGGGAAVDLLVTPISRCAAQLNAADNAVRIYRL
jgi:hypothetical protein